MLFTMFCRINIQVCIYVFKYYIMKIHEALKKVTNGQNFLTLKKNSRLQ